MNKLEKPPWFNEIISRQIINYDDPTFINKQFTKKDNNIITDIVTTTKNPTIIYQQNEGVNIKKEAFKLLNKYLDKSSKISNNKLLNLIDKLMK